LHFLFACFELYAVSRLGIHGGKYARTFISGLRKIVRKDRSSFGEPVREKAPSSESRTDSRNSDFCRCFRYRRHCVTQFFGSPEHEHAWR
jgi:hypothetical protein